MNKIDSQVLKDLFNDKKNNKPYDIEVYCAYNLYPIKTIVFVKEENKFVIITEEIGGSLSDDEEE